MQIVTQTEIQEYPLIYRGKVRDIYSLNKDSLLIVTTDRMSAFDVVLPDPIPYKGIVLNQLTLFWMKKFNSFVDNHLLKTEVENFPEVLKKYASQLENRAVIVRKVEPLSIECIVRGYLSGSGWQNYLQNGLVCGYSLPQGLRESEKLPEPLFTPSTKAEIGDHDENITLDQAKDKLGGKLLQQVKNLSVAIYNHAVEYAERRGIIIADTKFEFGLANDNLLLIDEVLTPDSSRFWPQEEYTPGTSQPSFDKQYLRDWLNKNWNRKDPPPRLPIEIIEQTQAKYLEAYKKLTEQTLM